MQSISVSTTQASTRRHEFTAGLKAEIPLLLGVIPFGMIYGVVARGAGIPPAAAQAMSAIVFAGSAQFIPELRAMRKRIVDAAGADSFKGGPGGLYDLDFILGWLEARAGLPAAGRQLPERLAALGEAKLLAEDQGAELVGAAGLFRRVEHAIRVVEGRPRKWLPESDALRAAVERQMNIPELNDILRAQMRRVRVIFDSIFSD